MAELLPGSAEPRALVRKRTDTDLNHLAPPAKKIKRPRQVLDEDTYTDTLSYIIAREFFPGLLESETRQEYLDAVESKDNAWIASASKRLHRVMAPSRHNKDQTPSPASSEPKINANMSLNTFQSTYTSEDNESFYKLIDKQNQKKADKYSWLWRGNRLPSKRELKQKEVEAKRGNDSLPVIDKGGDARPAMPDTWNSKPNNQLMFLSDGEEERGSVAIEHISGGAPPQVVPANTRLGQDNTMADFSRPPSPTLSAIRDAIKANPSSDYADSSAGVGGSVTPRVNGYAFVEDEEPEKPERVNKNQVALGLGDATPNPFSIKEGSKREALHRRMVERIAESKRTSSRLGMTGKEGPRMAPKYPVSPRVGGTLTPAAQRLWSNMRPGDSSTPSRTALGLQTPTPLRSVLGRQGAASKQS